MTGIHSNRAGHRARLPPARAYWLSPAAADGRSEIIPVITTHIETVCSDAAGFGLALGEIRQAYLRHREPVGFEGKARAEIMTALLRVGWVRIRARPNRWVAELTGTAEDDRLVRWARRMLAAREAMPEDELVVGVLDGLTARYSFATLASRRGDQPR